MNPRPTLFLLLVLAAVSVWSSGLLRGQVRSQGGGLTVFFTGEHGGEIAPCG